MPTTVISARVDTATLRRAMRVIDARSTSLADVIKDTINRIAVTGELPLDELRKAQEAAFREQGRKRFEEFRDFCDSVEWAPWLATLTDEEMKDMIASKYA